jgi:hypothetical protein
MYHQERLEQFVRSVGAMNRPALISQMLHFQGRFPVDFTADYLHRLTDERLRHIYLAMCLQHDEEMAGSVMAA